MILPNYLRINKGDYPEESKPLIDKLAGTLNPGIDTLYNLANHRISLGDNLAAVLKDVPVTVDANGIPTSITGIDLGNVIKKAIGSDVIFAENQTITTNYPTAKPFITFTQNGTTFVIDHISGLPAGNQFTLRVVVWGA